MLDVVSRCKTKVQSLLLFYHAAAGMLWALHIGFCLTTYQFSDTFAQLANPFSDLDSVWCTLVLYSISE